MIRKEGFVFRIPSPSRDFIIWSIETCTRSTKISSIRTVKKTNVADGSNNPWLLLASWSATHHDLLGDAARPPCLVSSAPLSVDDVVPPADDSIMVLHLFGRRPLLLVARVASSVRRSRQNNRQQETRSFVCFMMTRSPLKGCRQPHFF